MQRINYWMNNMTIYVTVMMCKNAWFENNYKKSEHGRGWRAMDAEIIDFSRAR